MLPATPKFYHFESTVNKLPDISIQIAVTTSKYPATARYNKATGRRFQNSKTPFPDPAFHRPNVRTVGQPQKSLGEASASKESNSRGTEGTVVASRKPRGVNAFQRNATIQKRTKNQSITEIRGVNQNDIFHPQAFQPLQRAQAPWTCGMFSILPPSSSHSFLIS